MKHPHLAGAHDCAQCVNGWLSIQVPGLLGDQAVFAVGRWDDLMPRTDYGSVALNFPICQSPDRRM